MSEQPGSQTVTPTETESAVSDWRSALGLASDITDDDFEEEPAQETTAKEEPAAKQEAPAASETKKGITVKFNKEETFVDEDKIPEFVQKGLALDRERERRSEYEKALDRAAKLQGFTDHAELMANLDRIEQEREQKQKDDFEQLKQQVIDDLITNGVDEQQARSYAENNPLIAQARQALQEKEQIRQQQNEVQQQQQYIAKWSELYDAFPDLRESAKAFTDGGRPDWYTSEMESMVQQGYHPLHAYKLANMDRLTTQTKKQTEQQVIKQQMLGQRAAVETVTSSDDGPEVPDSVKSAFAAFGLDPRRAAKHFKK